MRGKFIAFEGCEGAGKSTQIRLLSARLKEEGIPHTVTREPGGGRISEAIRGVILDGRNGGMTDECEALLYAAARAQHLADVVAPAMDRGEIVLCDRYIFSTYAYQGYGRGLPLSFLEEINACAVRDFMPDLSLFLDIPPQRSFQRKHGADENDRMEQAGEAFHRRVYEGYTELLAKFPDKFLSVYCGGTKYETNENIVKLLRGRALI